MKMLTTVLDKDEREAYDALADGAPGYRVSPRGLISVWGGESDRFLNGLVTNDVAKLEDGQQISAAFPNAQGRLLALVRIFRSGDRFYFETEEATRQKVYDNLFRFTFAGDFFAEDLSAGYRFFELLNVPDAPTGFPVLEGGAVGRAVFVEADAADGFRGSLDSSGAVAVSERLYEVLRVEGAVPLYGVDADESTVVPELGSEGLISYNKGCYIGQEVIARIHFRGHVAKELRQLVFDSPAPVAEDETELTSADGRSAGRITSAVLSPKFGAAVGLGLVRYEFLAEGTELMAGARRVRVGRPDSHFG